MEITPTVEYLRNFFERNNTCEIKESSSSKSDKKNALLQSKLSDIVIYPITSKCNEQKRQLKVSHGDEIKKIIHTDISPSSTSSGISSDQDNSISDSPISGKLSIVRNRRELFETIRPPQKKTDVNSKPKVKPVVPRKPSIPNALHFSLPTHTNLENKPDNIRNFKDSSNASTAYSIVNERNRSASTSKFELYTSLKDSVNGEQSGNTKVTTNLRKHGVAGHSGLVELENLQSQQIKGEKSLHNSFSFKYVENWNNDNSLSSSNQSNQENKKPNISGYQSCNSYSSLENGMTISSDSSNLQSIMKKHSSVGSRSQKSLSFKKELVSYAPDSDCTSEASFLSFTNKLFEATIAKSSGSTAVVGHDTIRSSSTLRNNTPLTNFNDIKSAPLGMGCSASNISGNSRRLKPDASYSNQN